MERKLKPWLIAVLIMIPLGCVLSGGLIDCEGDYCTFCDLIALIQNIINLFIRVIIWYIALVYIMYAGFLMVVGKKANGIAIIKKVLTGLVIILLAWTIVNSLIYVLAPAAKDENGNDLSKTWNRIDCSKYSTPSSKENTNN
jgi:ethanolamine transporter EutH